MYYIMYCNTFRNNYCIYYFLLLCLYIAYKNYLFKHLIHYKAYLCSSKYLIICVRYSEQPLSCSCYIKGIMLNFSIGKDLNLMPRELTLVHLSSNIIIINIYYIFAVSTIKYKIFHLRK